jgi:hypothetical protein
MLPTHSVEARHVGEGVHSTDLAGMHQRLNKKATVFRSINKRASQNLVNAAQVKIFNDYFSAKNPVEKARLKKKILKISLFAQRGFEIDEMCLISMDGREIIRIVLDKIVPESDLSPDKSKAPFFKASVKTGRKEIHIQDPYLSYDSRRWVIAYTTPIVTAGGDKPAFLHYEMPLSFFLKKMAHGTDGEDEYVLIVGNDGLLWADSRHERDLKGDPAAGIKASTFFPRLDDWSSPRIKKILKTMREGKSGSDNFREKGVQYDIVYKPLGYFDWNIVVVNRE